MSTIINKTDTLGNVAVGIQALNGTAVDTNSGNKSAGTMRIVIATDQPQLTNAWKVDGSGVTQPVSGTVTANAGTGIFTIQGPIASGSANGNNPMKIGGVFNTTQPTVTTGQVVDLQATARGAMIVATGVDAFNVTVNTALPAGTNTIGAVKLTDGTNPLMGTAAALADGATNPTLAGLQAYLMLFNGATWERARGDLGDGSSPTGVLVNNSLLYNGSTYDRQYGDKTNGAWVNVKALPAIPTGTNAIGDVNLNPATRGGWSSYFANAITTTVTVSSAAGKFGGYMLINLNSTPAYLQVFDTTGAVTLGSTVPTFVIPIPANSTAANGLAANLELANGAAVANGIKVAATTTPNGSTTVTTGLSGSIWYK